MANETIRVEGLRDLLRELRAADAAWPKEMRQASKEVAENVAEGTRAAFASMSGSAPKVAATVKALAQQRAAQVKVGGAGDSIPVMVSMGNLWGSNRYKQFPPHRKGGYALYPTIAALREQNIDAYANAVERLVAKAFPTRS